MEVVNITQKDFGESTILYSLTNNNGVTLCVSNLGARIVDLIVPVSGEKRNIVLGFDSAKEYIEKDLYIGATVGRVAGRIEKGQFTINDKKYQLPVDPLTGNTLHGGAKSFESRLWESRTEETEERISVIFTYESPDHEHGFPGNLKAEVIYSLTNEDEWIIDYQATTDQPTIYNPTNHVYFNLTGDVTKTVGEHSLFIDADRFAVVDEATSVTGELRNVTDTPFDFRNNTPIKQVFETDYKQNMMVNGLDHPFLLNQTGFEKPQAIVTSPKSDVSIEMYTDRPAVVVFTAQFGENSPEMRGTKMVSHGGIALETQVSPGAGVFDGFGDISLYPDRPFHSRTIYKIKRSL
ncbi:galactose mutarotase [Enterococcus sp. DIV0242_7C1]|uniref:Aldose 1-epimerase n=1 Tax=Candidatus Enterococcus dunnyi TaxID=1834192 RepID=A0A200J9V1_9ENTE|nr:MULTISPECIES: aldose epimerase family protein [unclassified Enterococcus]MBO0472003.1 galactose mutarotase [Enterococcus sp. DIV0242_7C1]OUZ33629.1 galactose mutarotase [Enterococcus sp. 9D6_DIV0238]